MKINFVFSLPFKRSLTNLCLERDSIHLSVEEVDKKIASLAMFWDAEGEDIENVLKDVTRYGFIEEKIDYYVNSKISISHPFCVKFNEDNEKMKGTVIHELIHILFKQNNLVVSKGAKIFKEDFKDEHILTSNHIMLHAIHFVIAQKLFPDRLEIIQKKKNPYYVRSWDIVNQIGAENLIKKYLKEL